MERKTELAQLTWRWRCFVVGCAVRLERVGWGADDYVCAFEPATIMLKANGDGSCDDYY